MEHLKEKIYESIGWLLPLCSQGGVFIIYIYIYNKNFWTQTATPATSGGFLGQKSVKRGNVAKKRQKNIRKTMTCNFFLQKKHFFQKKS